MILENQFFTAHTAREDQDEDSTNKDEKKSQEEPYQ